MTNPFETSQHLDTLRSAVEEFEKRPPEEWAAALPYVRALLVAAVAQVQQLEYNLERYRILEFAREIAGVEDREEALQRRVAAEMSRPGSNVVPLPTERPIGSGGAA